MTNVKDTRSLKVAPTDGEKDGSMHNGNSSGSSGLTAGSAVETTDDKEDQSAQKSESLLENRSAVNLDHLPELVKQPVSTMDVMKPRKEKRDERFQ
ncbi:hypothetical protein ACET3Z_018026 [Daucus carota]